MFKLTVVAPAIVAAAFMLPLTAAVPAQALPVTKPAAKEMTLKHDVGRRFRGFRGFRGHRGFRRGFRGRRGFRRGFHGFRGGYRRGLRSRKWRRFGHRRFYRPKFRFYYGAPYVSHRYYNRGACYHLKKRAIYTGSHYWWRRYRKCLRYYY